MVKGFSIERLGVRKLGYLRIFGIKTDPNRYMCGIGVGPFDDLGKTIREWRATAIRPSARSGREPIQKGP